MCVAVQGPLVVNRSFKFCFIVVSFFTNIPKYSKLDELCMKANFILNFHQIIDESTISVNYPKFLLTACLRVIRISFVWKSKQEDDSKMLRGLRSNNPLLVKGVTDVPFGPVSAFSPTNPTKLGVE